MEGDAVAAALRELDRDALTAFVADLWGARGWAVERRNGLLWVRDGDEEHTLAPMRAAPLSRTSAVPEAADTVVTPDPDTFGGAGVRDVGPDRLVSMLRYGLPADAADRLCRAHFGASMDDLELPARLRARRAARRLPLRRMTVALALLVALGAFALTLPLDDVLAPGGTPAESGGRTGETPTANATALSDSNRSYTAAGLVAAHRETLNGSGYGFTVTRIRSDPGPDEARIRTRSVGVDGGRVRVNEGGVGLPGTVSGREVYIEGSTAFEATYRNQSFHYRPLDAPTDPLAASFATLERHLSTDTLGARGIVARDGERRTLVVGRGAPPWSNATDYSVEAYLDTEGFLHRVTAEYTRPTGGTASVTWTFRSPETVTPPGWYEREFRARSTTELISRAP